ncbi:MAG: PhoU domain-containing protein [Campylobacterota bacterium]|nr:PhoU domain-containing protein [Campylobacterota bacterium]
MLPRYEAQLNDLQDMISSLLNTTQEASAITLEAYQRRDNSLFTDAISKLKNIQSDANSIDNEIIKTFALFGPEAQELRTLVAYLKMTNEIVRIGEGVKKYARRMKEHTESECDLSPLNATIIQLHKSTLTALQLIDQCYANIDECDIEDFYRKVMVEESKNDDLFAILEKEILTQIIEESELAAEYVRVLGTLRKLERSCDRSVNIANLMLYAKQGGQMHIYS